MCGESLYTDGSLHMNVSSYTSFFIHGCTLIRMDLYTWVYPYTRGFLYMSVSLCHTWILIHDWLLIHVDLYTWLDPYTCRSLYMAGSLYTWVSIHGWLLIRDWLLIHYTWLDPYTRGSLYVAGESVYIGGSLHIGTQGPKVLARNIERRRCEKNKLKIPLEPMVLL